MKPCLPEQLEEEIRQTPTAEAPAPSMILPAAAVQRAASQAMCKRIVHVPGGRRRQRDHLPSRSSPRRISSSAALARRSACKRASLRKLIAKPDGHEHQHGAGVLDTLDTEGVERRQPEKRQREGSQDGGQHPGPKPPSQLASMMAG